MFYSYVCVCVCERVCVCVCVCYTHRTERGLGVCFCSLVFVPLFVVITSVRENGYSYRYQPFTMDWQR